MKKVFKFTVEQENSTLNLTEVLKKERLSYLLSEQIQKMQERFVALLTEAEKSEHSFPTYPEINLQEIIGDNALWLESFEDLSKKPFSAEALSALWAIVAVHKKMEEFYREASQNTPRPLAKIFFTSLAELKSLCLAKIMTAVDILQNKVWQEVEFSPFKLN